jgi:hypothetical protein
VGDTMEYFVMKSDGRIRNPLRIDTSAIDLDTTEAFVAYADFQPNTTFVDYFMIKKLFQYSFCVSDSLKEMLDIYADRLTAVPFFITDRAQKGQKVYWKLHIELQDCLEKKPYMRYDELTLHKDKIPNKHIFRVAFQKQEYLIVSLNLAENILRKNPSGIQFIPVTIQ